MEWRTATGVSRASSALERETDVFQTRLKMAKTLNEKIDELQLELDYLKAGLDPVEEKKKAADIVAAAKEKESGK